MYADQVTPSMEAAITETLRRRKIQQAYNEEHSITPQTIQKDVREVLEISTKDNVEKKSEYTTQLSAFEREKIIRELTKEMRNAAKLLEFEHAAYLRDRIEKVRTGQE